LTSRKTSLIWRLQSQYRLPTSDPLLPNASPDYGDRSSCGSPLLSPWRFGSLCLNFLFRFHPICCYAHPVLFAFRYMRDLCRSRSGLSVGFHNFHPIPPPRPSKTHMIIIHICCIFFFYLIYVVLLHRCSRYPVSASPYIPNRSYPRVALFLGNIHAQTPLVAKLNHCILIARYFVSRRLSSMYYTILLA